ncbi:MAG: cytochrome c [Verrucomicrobiota bacterium]|nr:cytochrome c [Verrucomicrobiota bacterium]
MKIKTQALLKTTVVAALFAGALCWSAAAGEATQNWDANCAACHGKDGKGQTKIGQKLGIKDLTDAKVQASFTDAEAAKDIKEGITADGRKKMKAFGDKFSDDEVKALVAYVRGLKQ